MKSVLPAKTPPTILVCRDAGFYYRVHQPRTVHVRRQTIFLSCLRDANDFFDGPDRAATGVGGVLDRDHATNGQVPADRADSLPDLVSGEDAQFGMQCSCLSSS